MDQKKSTEPAPGWTFLSNHGHVLLAIARDPSVTLREVADLVGITERAVQRIVRDLESGGYLERARAGRRNRYEVCLERPLRHPIEAHRDVGALIDLVLGSLPRAEDRPDPDDRAGGAGRPRGRAVAKPRDPVAEPEADAAATAEVKSPARSKRPRREPGAS